jgi:hypothetical protein
MHYESLKIEYKLIVQHDMCIGYPAICIMLIHMAKWLIYMFLLAFGLIIGIWEKN